MTEFQQKKKIEYRSTQGEKINNARTEFKIINLFLSDLRHRNIMEPVETRDTENQCDIVNDILGYTNISILYLILQSIPL